jgi:hypothetical protein
MPQGTDTTSQPSANGEEPETSGSQSGSAHGGYLRIRRNEESRVLAAKILAERNYTRDPNAKPGSEDESQYSRVESTEDAAKLESKERMASRVKSFRKPSSTGSVGREEGREPETKRTDRAGGPRSTVWPQRTTRLQYRLRLHRASRPPSSVHGKDGGGKRGEETKRRTRDRPGLAFPTILPYPVHLHRASNPVVLPLKSLHKLQKATPDFPRMFRFTQVSLIRAQQAKRKRNSYRMFDRLISLSRSCTYCMQRHLRRIWRLFSSGCVIVTNVHTPSIAQL